MATIILETGQEIEFDGNPTQSQVEEAVRQINGGEASQQQESVPQEFPKENLAQGIGKSAARGFIGAGEMALTTEQNAANLLGKIIGHVTGKDIPVAQWYGDQAKKLNMLKEDFYTPGNVSSSIGGKIIEGLASGPGMVGAVSVAGGGIPGFATLGAINKQEQGLGGMVSGGLEGATVGYLFDKFKGLKLVPRAAAGATVGAVQSGMAGNETDQIIADAATNGFFTAAQPGVMKEILDLGKSTGANIIGGARNIAAASSLVGKGVAKMAEVIQKTPDNFNQFVSILKEGRRAAKDIIQIDAQKRGLRDELSGTIDELKRQQFLLEDIRAEQSDLRMKRDSEIAAQKLSENSGIEALELSAKAKKELYEVKKSQIQIDKELAEKQVSAYVENDLRRINSEIDSHEKNRTTDIIGVTKDLKSGKIQQFFKNLSHGYEVAADRIFDFIDQGSPVKPGQVLDMLAEQASRIVEGGANDSPVLRKIYSEIESIKSQQLKQAGIGPEEKMLRDKMESQRLVREAKYPGTTKPPTVQEEQSIPFKKVRQVMKRVMDADQYGSHESDIVRQHFLEATNEMVRKSGGSKEASLSYEKLQRSMSDAISYKQKIARIFGIKGGAANWEEGAKSLASLYNESGMTAEQRIANRANREAINYLEKGNNLTQGIGDISSGLQKQAEKLQTLSEHFKKTQSSEKGRLLQVGQEFNSKLQELQKQGKLSDKVLSRESENFKSKMEQEMAAIEMKYELADHALQKAVKERQQVVRKGNEFVIEKGKEIRTVQELARIKREAIAKRHEALGFARALVYTLGGVGLWKLSRVGQAAVGMERYSE